MKKYFILLVAVILSVACAQKAKTVIPELRSVPPVAEQAPGIDPTNDYLAGEFYYGQDTLRYRYMEPIAVEKGKSYPLVLFLHGAGERGSDNWRQLIHCSRMFSSPVNRENYPAYVLFPQCPSDGYWAYEDRPGFSLDTMPLEFEETDVMKAVLDLVDAFVANYPIDEGRLYIAGLSMGGMATYDAVIRHPKKFAAAVPICGAVNNDRLTAEIKTPFRIFHGDADPVIPLKFSRVAYWRLKEAGVEVEYKEYPGVGHNSWDPAVTEEDFLPWMFSKKRKW